MVEVITIQLFICLFVCVFFIQGNIALHIMMQDVRDEYDIETLWTCGAEYDDKSREAEKDPYVFPAPLFPDPSSNPGQGSEISKE